MNDPDIQDILNRRAEQLARLPAASCSADEFEVLTCQMGDERYAVETRHLRSVQWASAITPVPCTPGFVIGIVSVRGEIVTLLDLGTMIGLRARPLLAEDRPVPVLLLGLPGVRAGLVVDEVLDVERVETAALRPAPSAREFVRGIGPKDTVVLDVEALLGSGRFTVADT